MVWVAVYRNSIFVFSEHCDSLSITTGGDTVISCSSKPLFCSKVIIPPASFSRAAMTSYTIVDVALTAKNIFKNLEIQRATHNLLNEEAIDPVLSGAALFIPNDYPRREYRQCSKSVTGIDCKSVGESVSDYSAGICSIPSGVSSFSNEGI
jgi:hypothetical protein